MADMNPDEMVENLTGRADQIPQYAGVNDLIDALREEHPQGGEPLDFEADNPYEPSENEEFTYEAAESILRQTVAQFTESSSRARHVEKIEELGQKGQYDELESYTEEVLG